MKEFRLISVVSQGEAGFDRPTQTKAFTEAVARRLTREAGGDYYGYVPEECRPLIDEMATYNADATSFEELLNPDAQNAMRQNIARGWLIRREVVPRILREEGFRDIAESPRKPNQGELNRSTIAVLTGKGTVIIVGKGGLASDGAGTAIVWEPLPERTREKKHVPTMERGARVVGKPEHGKPWGIQYRDLKEACSGPVFQEEAAPLIAIFIGPPAADLQTIEEQIKVSDGQVNRMFGKKK